MTRRTWIIPLVTLCALGNACYDCDQRRSAEFTGHLGDSTIAVGFLSTAPGGLEMSLEQYDARSQGRDLQTLVVKVNYATFADSLLKLQFTDFNDPTRTPILSLSKTAGSQSASVFDVNHHPYGEQLNLELWDVLLKGDGMLEVVPHQGEIVRARLKVLNNTGWKRFCP